MSTVKLAEDLRPASELKSQSADVIRQAKETGRPVVLTRSGRGVAVVLSIDAFDDLVLAAGRRSLQRAVDDAERDMESGHFVEHDQVVTRIHRLTRGKK